MASFSTTKVFAGLLSITAADLDAIVAQLSAAPGLISDRAAAGATVDGDLFLVLKGGVLQQMTAQQIKTYLGQVFVPSGVGFANNVSITTAAPVLGGPWTQLVASITFTTISGAARKVMGWVNVFWQPGGTTTGVTLGVYRQDSVTLTSIAFTTKDTTSNYSPNLQWIDVAPLNGSTTYYLLAQATGGTGTVVYGTMSGVQM